MKESLRYQSFATFKSNPSSYIAVGIMCGLFLILSVLIAFVDPLLLILALPLLGLPFLFASHISCFYLRLNQPITVSAYIRYFLGFFRSQFRGSFRVMISYLKSLGFYFGSILVATFIVYLVYRLQYGTVFVDALNKFIFQYISSTEATYDDILNILNENNGLLLTFFIYISAFGMPVGLLSFIYYISFSSLSIYFRTSIPFVASPLLKMSVSNTYRHHRHKMAKDWFKLNWPILLLSLVGMVLFALIDILLIKRIDLLPGFVIVGGVSLLMFYLPLYFTNMETIYMKYEQNFIQGNQEAINTVLQRIQNSIDLSEEEKRNLEESLRGKENDEK